MADKSELCHSSTKDREGLKVGAEVEMQLPIGLSATIETDPSRLSGSTSPFHLQ